MEIVETPEHEPSNIVNPCSEVQPSAQVESPTIEAPSEQEPQSQKEPSSETKSASEVPPAQNAPSSQTVPSTEASSSVAGSSKEAAAVPPNAVNGPAAKKQRLDYNSMSTGVYLDSTVVPILHVALVTLDRLRPSDPVQFVIDFLLRHKAQYSKSKEQQVPSTSANQA